MFFKTPEFLDYQEQTTAYEEVIGGSGARTQRNGSSLLALKQPLHMAALSLALIGKASAHDSQGEDMHAGRGLFDKET